MNVGSSGSGSSLPPPPPPIPSYPYPPPPTMLHHHHHPGMPPVYPHYLVPVSAHGGPLGQHHPPPPPPPPPPHPHHSLEMPPGHIYPLPPPHKPVTSSHHDPLLVPGVSNQLSHDAAPIHAHHHPHHHHPHPHPSADPHHAHSHPPPPPPPPFHSPHLALHDGAGVGGGVSVAEVVSLTMGDKSGGPLPPPPPLSLPIPPPPTDVSGHPLPFLPPPAHLASSSSPLPLKQQRQLQQITQQLQQQSHSLQQQSQHLQQPSSPHLQQHHQSLQLMHQQLRLETEHVSVHQGVEEQVEALHPSDEDPRSGYADDDDDDDDEEEEDDPDVSMGVVVDQDDTGGTSPISPIMTSKIEEMLTSGKIDEDDDEEDDEEEERGRQSRVQLHHQHQLQQHHLQQQHRRLVEAEVEAFKSESIEIAAMARDAERNSPRDAVPSCIAVTVGIPHSTSVTYSAADVVVSASHGPPPLPAPSAAPHSPRVIVTAKSPERSFKQIQTSPPTVNDSPDFRSHFSVAPLSVSRPSSGAGSPSQTPTPSLPLSRVDSELIKYDVEDAYMEDNGERQGAYDEYEYDEEDEDEEEEREDEREEEEEEEEEDVEEAETVAVRKEFGRKRGPEFGGKRGPEAAEMSGVKEEDVGEEEEEEMGEDDGGMGMRTEMATAGLSIVEDVHDDEDDEEEVALPLGEPPSVEGAASTGGEATVRVLLNEVSKSKHQKELVGRFFSKGCSCSLGRRGQPCYTGFSIEEIVKKRNEALDLPRNERELLVKAYLLHMRREPATHPETTYRTPSTRRAAWTEYTLHGKKICRKTFAFLHGMSDSTLKRVCGHYDKFGLKKRAHGNQGKKPINAVTAEDGRVIADFVVAFARTNGSPVVPLSASNNLVKTVSGVELSAIRPYRYILPHTKKDVWLSYKGHCEEAGLRVVKLSKWRSFWPDTVLTPCRADMRPQGLTMRPPAEDATPPLNPGSVRVAPISITDAASDPDAHPVIVATPQDRLAVTRYVADSPTVDDANLRLAEDHVQRVVHPSSHRREHKTSATSRRGKNAHLHHSLPASPRLMDHVTSDDLPSSLPSVVIDDVTERDIEEAMRDADGTFDGVVAGERVESGRFESTPARTNHHHQHSHELERNHHHGHHHHHHPKHQRQKLKMLGTKNSLSELYSNPR